MKKLLLIGFMLLFSLIPAVVLAATTTREFSFDQDAAGFDCHAASGYLWPDPICRSPWFSGNHDTVGVAVFAVGDLGGMATARLVDRAGVVLCESHGSIPSGQPSHFDLHCGAVRGDHRLELVEGSGSIFFQFVRIDWNSYDPPTATPSPVPTMTPAPSPVPTIQAYTYAPSYPAGGSYQVGSYIPPTATPAPTSVLDCRVHLRIYEAAGMLIDTPVDVEFVSDRTVSLSIPGFAVVTVPCGPQFVIVRAKDGQMLSDPQFLQIRHMDALDLGVHVLPAPTAAPAAEPTVSPVGVNWGDINFFDPGSLTGDPNAGLAGLQLADITTLGVRSPVTTTEESSSAPVIVENTVQKSAIDWGVIIGIAAVCFVVVRLVSVMRR